MVLDDKTKNVKLKSAQIIPLGFLSAIVLGTLLLLLPFSTAEGETTGILTALFTSTTSICVTGLVVVDTFSHWSLFGQIIILLLIQLGGFGIITVAAITLKIMRKKIGLQERILIQDAYNLEGFQGMVSFLTKVVRGTLYVEALGACMYAFRFVPEFGLVKGLWISLFTSVSAFCNAGIDIIGPNSLINYNGSIYVNFVTMGLIVLGGLGFVVWFDFFNVLSTAWDKKYSPKAFIRKMSPHSKLVLNITLILILAGALLVFLFERNNPATIGDMPLWKKVLCSLFQSVTFRTAGFASIPQESLTPETCVIGYLLMFIGGSPVGTAGGVKTVTFAVIILNVVSFIRSRSENVIFNRKISMEFINKATAIVTVSLFITITLTLLLMYTNKVNVVDACYEMFSATATVGLSRGLTSKLDSVGKIIVIIGMYLGRIGPITMALFFSVGRSEKNNINFPNGKFIVG